MEGGGRTEICEHSSVMRVEKRWFWFPHLSPLI